MVSDGIKIYISCHKDCYIPTHPLLFPIQVGASLSEKQFPNMLHDNEGDNISDRNRMYCELTAYYWAWKNDTQAIITDFGITYRRYMSFADRQFPHNPFEDVCIDYLDGYAIKLLNLDENVMREKISQYDVIATTPVVLKKLNICLKSNRHQYESTPYLSVTLASIAKNVSADKNYDIFVLTTDISETNKKQILEITAKYENFSLRFVNPKLKRISKDTEFLFKTGGNI